MAVPLRKDDREENLSTADLAQSKRPAAAAATPGSTSVTTPVPTKDQPGPVLANRPAAEASGKESPAVSSAHDNPPLIPTNELADLRNRWSSIQTAFVDEPRRAVEQADGLVASAMKRLAEVFAEERSRLEQQWDRGDNVSTEDLRVALQRYRSFFHRLLSI
jgi:hypothetical protein